ncbi:AraC family transcriptional regulator [Flavobacteriaceae bacterium R38]|nr:AraC family transcriptional regulator [Flavobacteriaceae bacterium R38]
MAKDLIRKVFFIVPPEVQLLDITGPAHIFYEAKASGAKIELIYLNMHGKSAEMSGAGVSLGNLQDYKKIRTSENDWIIIPGIESNLIFNNYFKANFKEFYNWLQKQQMLGAKICSVCTGLYLLAYADVLNEKNCTTHWKYFNHFEEEFPNIKIHKNRLFVKDQNIYSSAGVSSGIDLSLYLLEEAYGPLFAIKIAKEVLIYLRRAEGDPQLSIFLEYRNHLEERIHNIQNYLSEHFNKGLNILQLAEMIHMSPRNLTRLFKKHTGITIGGYIEKLRVEKAIHLMSEGNKLEAIARECGVSRNQLTNLLKKHRSSLPTNMS